MKLTPMLDSAALDALFEPYNRCDRPGVAVGVAVGGVPRYRRGFGVASIETGAALSPAIRMRIGSVSKHFTALAILLLEEDGKLSRDMSIRHFLPELGDVAARVTLAHLMSNTSGLRCGHDLIWTGSGIGCTTTRDAPVEVMHDLTSVNFAPGEGWSYCNGGFALLDRVVERVSGQDFGDFLRERIFAPIGMNDTLVRAVDTDLVPNSATLHVPLVSGGYRRGDFGIPIGGEGGIVSTVDDMLRWLRHMAAPMVGSAESWAAMQSPRSTHGYGFGLLATEYRGQRTLQHSGGVIGGVCQMIRLPDAGLDIIIIANSAGIDPVGLAEKIIDLSLPDLPAKPDGKVILPIEGVFHSATSGRTLRLSVHDDIAMLDLAGTPLPLTALPGGAIGLANAISDLRITASGDHAIELVEFGARDRLDRAEPPSAAAPIAIGGRFVCDDARIAVEIRCEADQAPRADFSGPWGAVSWALEPLANNLWATIFEPSSSRPGGTLAFDASGFCLSTIQTHRLRFRRH